VNRDWFNGQKCTSCERGGQACGPNRHHHDSQLPQTLLYRAPAAPSVSSISGTRNGSRNASQSRRPSRNAGATRADASRIQCFGYTNTFPAKEPYELPDQWPAWSDDHSDASKTYGSKLCDESVSSSADRNRFTRLGYLRIALENIQGLQRSVGPHTIAQETNRIENNLKYMAWCVTREYQTCIKQLVRIAGIKKPDVAKLIYLEVLEDVNHVQDEGGISGLRTIILQRLISIYRLQQNLPAVERISKQLSDNMSRSPEINGTPIFNSLAQCYVETSAEINIVFDEINMCIEPPLYVTSNALFPPLHRALRGGLDEVARVLCTSSEALSAVDMLRQNVVMAAAATGKIALLESVICEKPQILADRDLLARTALFHAAQQGDFDSFSYLVSAGADIRHRDWSGSRIIDAAAASGSTMIVDYLLGMGISPNDDTVGLPSALHEAARSGHEDVCSALLSHGAWANFRSPVDGKTPSRVALENGYNNIAAMLEEAEQYPKNNFWCGTADSWSNKQDEVTIKSSASSDNALSGGARSSRLLERPFLSSHQVLTPDMLGFSTRECSSTPDPSGEMTNDELRSPSAGILSSDYHISTLAQKEKLLQEDCKPEIIDLTVLSPS
jgi:ankyrin repeat protein